MKETIGTIIAWHRETFPDATLEGQLEKFDDEVKEFWECELLSEDAATELADCFIVACGIARFSNTRATDAFSFVAGYIDGENDFMKKFEDAVQEKMAINRQRKWNFNNGQYQHKEL